MTGISSDDTRETIDAISIRNRIRYRVSHSEECKVNQLRGRRTNNFVELGCLSSVFRRFGNLSFMNQFSKK